MGSVRPMMAIEFNSLSDVSLMPLEKRLQEIYGISFSDSCLMRYRLIHALLEKDPAVRKVTLHKIIQCRNMFSVSYFKAEDHYMNEHWITFNVETPF